ncbi:hypothetical protein I4F81_007104 [Pyropia yezoensis]|uniref:Uncharacterized protein n=1 Tax=Pyropia yezoensis TaxID=2788 RepID=A0ACC3C438_PYRYE|nr:hypothetical protein I4F81_007104 [Neopyropia yezoensis]
MAANGGASARPCPPATRPARRVDAHPPRRRRRRRRPARGKEPATRHAHSTAPRQESIPLAEDATAAAAAVAHARRRQGPPARALARRARRTPSKPARRGPCVVPLPCVRTGGGGGGGGGGVGVDGCGGLQRGAPPKCRAPLGEGGGGVERRCGTVAYRTVRCGAVRCGAERCRGVRCGVVRWRGGSGWEEAGVARWQAEGGNVSVPDGGTGDGV